MSWTIARKISLACALMGWLIAIGCICMSEQCDNPPARNAFESISSEVQFVAHNEFVGTPIPATSFQNLPPVTPQERETLASLPPACLSGLPGITTANSTPADVAQFAPSIPADSPFEQLAIPLAPVDVNQVPFNPHAQATRERRMSVASKTASPALPPHDLHPQHTPCEDPHAEVFAQGLFPSAQECRKCHERIYDEWAVSSHANAGLSPMFHKFEQKLQALAQGTLGSFCYRCHAPVATIMQHPREMSVFEGPQVYREGVTCVVCHRVAEQYAKTNGERRLEPGPLEAPTYGNGSGDAVELLLKYRDQYKLKTDPADKSPGQLIHRRVIQFEEISKSTFCTSCHQVAVHPGIKLEVVWEQYRNSPAYRQGIRCQDCHMGKVPGLPEGFEVDCVAKVNDKPIGVERKHSNHLFFGPGYSIAHPGLFPHHPQANRWTPQQWLSFDWRAGWGTEAFEQRVERGEFANCFPPEWSEVDDRMDAREILDANFKRLRYKDETRMQVMENGSQIAGPFFSCDTQCDDGSFAAGKKLRVRYQVTNRNAGHNMPTGSLGAQPQLWMNVVLVNPAGETVWQTGYLDSQGDLADNHSIEVHKGLIPFDKQLVNYQTKFLITNLKGTDREMPLPVNLDIDQLPFLRPAPQPISVMNHPPFIRMEAHSIPPLGSRDASYEIPASALTMPGTYRLSSRLRNRGEPIYFMKFVESTPEMIRRMNEKILDIHRHTVTFEVR
jgi:Cytochrome c554 and c-prime